MLAYDSGNDAFVLFGGWTQTSAETYVRLDDTWVFFVGNSTWVEEQPLRSPSARSDSAVAYDPLADRILILGGFAGSAYLGDMWAYSLRNNSWFPIASSSGPSPRADGRMTFDYSTRAFYLFSGNDYSGPNFTFHHLDDMWRYDSELNYWTELHPSVMPSPRDYAVFASDQDLGELLLTGGFGNRTVLGDTWAFNVTRSTWSNITTNGGPSPRIAAVGGYDSEDGVLGLFSGGDDYGVKDDTWLFRYPPPIQATILIPNSRLFPGQPATFAAVYLGGSGNFVSERWSLGDGSSAAGPSTTHAFASAGTYPVLFEVSDDRGDAGTVQANVTVSEGFASWATIPLVVSALGFAVLLAAIFLLRVSKSRRDRRRMPDEKTKTER